LLGNAYLYKPAVTEADYKKKFMNGVVKEYFDNSYKELVNFFVEQKKLSAKELKEIITLIEKGNNK
jgi:BlaI family transcriptional regulator, penicillinase repressor